MQCSNCGASLRPAAKICIGCGTPVPIDSKVEVQPGVVMGTALVNQPIEIQAIRTLLESSVAPDVTSTAPDLEAKVKSGLVHEDAVGEIHVQSRAGMAFGNVAGKVSGRSSAPKVRNWLVGVGLVIVVAIGIAAVLGIKELSHQFSVATSNQARSTQDSTNLATATQAMPHQAVGEPKLEDSGESALGQLQSSSGDVQAAPEGSRSQDSEIVTRTDSIDCAAARLSSAERQACATSALGPEVAAVPSVDELPLPTLSEQLDTTLNGIAMYKTSLAIIFGRGRSADVPSWMQHSSRYSYLPSFSGVETNGETVTVGGETYELYSVCEPHDCHRNFLYVLFTSGGGTAWAVTAENSNILKFYGDPNLDLQVYLTNLCRKNRLKTSPLN